MQQQRTFDPLAMRSGELHQTGLKVGAIGLRLTWGFAAIAVTLAFAVTFFNTSTRTQRPTTSVTIPQSIDQHATVTTAAKPAGIDTSPKTFEAKNQSQPKEVDFLSRLKELAKDRPIQIQAGNSQIFYVYGVGMIKDKWGSLSERSNPVPINRAIAGEVAILGTEVRDRKLWLTGYQQGWSRLIVLDDNDRELYDGAVYVY